MSCGKHWPPGNGGTHDRPNLRPPVDDVGPHQRIDAGPGEFGRGPMAGMAGMPGAEDAQKFVASLQTNVSGLTLSLLNAGNPSLNIAFRSADAAKAQAFKADFDALRASLSGQFKLLAMAGMGQALGPAVTPIQAALDAQSQGTGNETTLTVPIPPELFQQGLANMPNPFESALSRGGSGQPGFGRPGFGGGLPGGS